MKKFDFSDIEKKIVSLKPAYKKTPSDRFLYSAKGRLISKLTLAAEEKAKRKAHFLSPKFGLSPMIAVLIYVVGVGIGVVIASEKSLPGQLLYPVKRLGESFAVATSIDPEQKAYLKIEITKRRADELLELVDKGKLEEAQKASEELRKALEESRKEIDKLPEDKKRVLEKAAKKSDEDSQEELKKAIEILEQEEKEKKKDNDEVKGKKDEKKEKNEDDHSGDKDD